MSIKLSFEKLADETCNIFADIFPQHENDIGLVAERVKFVQVRKFYEQDKDINTLLNVSFKELKRFAEDILKDN